VGTQRRKTSLTPQGDLAHFDRQIHQLLRRPENKDGNQALITARLRDAHLANHLWSET